MTDAQWENLMIPINMAFFFRSSLEDRVVTLYPSLPAPSSHCFRWMRGMRSWKKIAALSHLRPDIEGLLVNRVGHAQELSRAEYYIAPIDECYRLVGLIRANWKGLSGRHGGMDRDRALLLGAYERGPTWSARKPMPDLSFRIEQAAVVPFAIAPTLAFEASHR